MCSSAQSFGSGSGGRDAHLPLVAVVLHRLLEPEPGDSLGSHTWVHVRWPTTGILVRPGLLSSRNRLRSCIWQATVPEIEESVCSSGHDVDSRGLVRCVPSQDGGRTSMARYAAPRRPSRPNHH